MFVDLEGSDLRFQSRGRNTELGGRTQRSRHSASAFSQGSLNHLFFLSRKLVGERLARRLSLTRLPNEPTLIDREALRVTDDDRPFNYILQLSNVARPGVRLKLIQGLFVDAPYFLPRFTGITINEVLDQHGDVLFSLTQRRHCNGKYVEPIE